MGVPALLSPGRWPRLAVLPVVCVLAAARPAPLLADEPLQNPKPVRSTTRWGIELVAEGCKKSPSFRRLVEGLKRTAVIVYVEPVRVLPGLMHGATNFLGLSPTFRYLRVSIGTGATRKRLIALVAHELQHAHEIAAAPEVIDSATLESFYRRVGDDNPDGYDTPAARAMGDMVWNEVWIHWGEGADATDRRPAAPPPAQQPVRPAASSVIRQP